MWRLSIRPSRESGLPPVDVVVQARPDARVRDLARALGEHLAGTSTLVAPTTDGEPWPAEQRLAESDLRTGDVLDVRLVPDEWLHRPGRRRPARALARVTSGPDAGREFRVEGDALTIGRAATCTVRLSDPTVSRVHARVVLVDGPVVCDEGSAHGTRVGGAEVVRPQAVAWGEPVRVGETTVVLEQGERTGARGVSVLRPPRFGERLEPAELEVPAPPSAPRRQPLPWPMMLMPVLLGGGMFWMSRSPFSLLFMIGFPLMMLTTHLVQRRQQVREHAAELAVWRAEVQDVLGRLDEAARLQRERAAQDEPEVDALRAHVATGHRDVWVRRVDDDDFLRARVGLGPRPALVTATVARGGDHVQRGLVTAETSRRAVLDAQPVPVPLLDHGLVGLTGPTDDVDALLRAFVLRVAVTHSPADVSLAAVLAPGRDGLESWLRWLPHTARRAGGVEPVAVGAGPGAALLEVLLAERRRHGRTVCVVDESAGVTRRVVEAVAAQALDSGLHLVWVGRDPDAVPSATGVLVDLGRRAVLRRDRGGVDELTRGDALSLVDAWRIARRLSAFQDDAALVPADTALPDAVRLPELGADLVDPDDVAAVLDRWLAARGLRAQLGAGVDGVVTIDLREDGPHALVAGTTGSGKSELLQTLICSLALNNPPSRITFLLVDYKGGAAFREAADLPHTVGYITDLTPALVQRALVSLHAELARREHLLAQHGAKDLVAMERDHPEAAPPSMLICVDEFAALLAEVPEFVDGMVNIAQRGRSLGMHLLLATQRPAGVVTPQIKANTDLRIALRMASPEDSSDVIDAADAAELSRRTPGRAWLRRTGHGTRELVQVAWVGAREQLRDASEPVEVRAFSARALPAAATTGDGRVHERSDLERLVLTIGSAHVRSGAPAPRRPWLAPLASEVAMVVDAAGRLLVGTGSADEAAVPGSTPGADDLAPGRPGELVLGLVDRPAEQRQEPLRIDYARVGHLLVLGASGSGKTELLRTAAVAATAAQEPAPTLVYGIDFGGGGLAGIEVLQSVGAVVVEQAAERVQRLVRMLHRTVVDRNALLARAQAATIDDLRAQGVQLPRVHLLVDNLPGLLEAFDSGGPVRRQHGEQLLSILQEGRRCGVHVTATSPRRGGVPSAVQSAFGDRLVLRMPTADDYQMLGVPEDVLDADAPAGRGLHGRDEVQVARVADDTALADAEAVAARYASVPVVGVPTMPARLTTDRLPDPVADEVCLAVDAEFAAGVTLRLLEGPLLVAGRAGSGRTSVLLGLAELAERSSRPPARTVLVGPHAASLPAPHVDLVLDGPAPAAAWVRDLLAGPAPTGEDWDLVLLDDCHEWERGWESGDDRRAASEQLAALVDASRTRRVAVVVATDADDARARQHVAGPVTAARRSRRAVLLQPEMADGGLVGASVPMHTFEPLTGTGRGLMVGPGSQRVVQLLSPTTAKEAVS